MKRNRTTCLAAPSPAAVWASLVVTVVLAASARAQLRVVTYNTLEGPRPSLATVLEAIGEEEVEGIAKPIDILLLQEQTGPDGTTLAIVDMLNDIYGAGTYERATLSGGPAFSSIRQGLVYNTNTVELLQQIPVNVTRPRQPLRYMLRPVGYDSVEARLFAFNSHYKAGNEDEPSGNTTVGADRLAEAQAIRTFGDVLGEGAHIIYAGDFNMDANDEAAFEVLVDQAGPGQAVDPVNQADAFQRWNNNGSFARWHTQSPCSSGCPSGFVSGGMDDRFDLQLVTHELLDGEGLSYIDGTYRTFGNNGTTFNASVTSSQNTYPFTGVTTYTAEQVRMALFDASDHLPVVVDYQVPAVMSVSVDPIPARMIVGSHLLPDVTVENTADVVAPHGADELDYTISSSGVVLGGTTAMDAALGGGNSLPLFLNPGSTAGPKTGTIMVTSPSQAAQNATFEQQVAIDLVDHANPSLAADSDLDMLDIDFGQVALDSDVLTQTLGLFNLEATAGFTAGLDLDAIDASGDTNSLSIDLGLFSNLAAGQGIPFSALLDTSAAGLFESIYTLDFSDEDLEGESNLGSLTLRLTAEVVAGTPGDYDGDGQVTAADYTVWRDTIGSTADLRADGNGNMIIDGPDYGVWFDAFGTVTGSLAALAQVPEPTSGLLLIMATGPLFLLRRWRRNRSRLSRPRGGR